MTLTPSAPVADLVTAAREGSPRAVARLLSLVEDASPQLREVMAALAPHTGAAELIGVTGAPGVGKSTCTTGLVTAYRQRGRRVGVLAVDPSSPFTGGALLGDRIRMQEHALDKGVFIRSMASRGHLGGLAWATPQAVRVLDAAGCEVIIVETVGVGQSEIDIAGLADTTLVLVAPGTGDAIQIAKAGILEVGDIFVINKSDRDGADRVRRELRQMVSLDPRHSTDGPAGWRPPIVKTVASAGTGMDELVAALDGHRAYLAGGELTRRRAARVRDEIAAIAVTTLRGRVGAVSGRASLDRLTELVLSGQSDPYTAADELVAEVMGT